MFFLIDNKRKIIFGWSAKSGCTHVKALFYYLTEKVVNTYRGYFRHGYRDFNKLPKNLGGYEIILIVRNPYQRLVSGFVEKYKIGGNFHQRWPTCVPLTFRNFVYELNNTKFVDAHHFAPQFSEAWEDRVLNEDIKVWEIHALDYKYLESRFNTKIPKRILAYRGQHENVLPTVEFQKSALCDIILPLYQVTRPKAASLFDARIQSRVEQIYKKDFKTLKLLGFEYFLEKT